MDAPEGLTTYMHNPEPSRLMFLDGMRGWAALAVVLYHLLPTFIVTAKQQHVIKWLLPAMDGALAVYVFFVVSGFSLSIAYVRRSSKRTIASLAVRRYPRLMIPVLAASLLGYAMMQFGLNQAPRLAAMTGHTNWPASAYQFQASFLDAVRFGTWDVFFNYSSSHTYSPVLWTMSVELLGSAIVLGALAVMGRSAARWPVYIASWLAFAVTGSPLSAFVAGVVLAEAYDSYAIQVIRRSKTSLLLSLSMIGGVWFVAAGERQIYASATAISILGTVLVSAVVISEACTSALETRVSRLLGHLSFPLYLTHIVVLCTVAAPLGTWLIGEGASGYLVAFVETLVIAPLCLIVAWIFAPIESFSIASGKKLSRLIGLSQDARLSAVRSAAHDASN